MEILIVKDLIKSSIAVATDSGEKLFNEISIVLKKGEKVKVDFQDISIISTAFLNAAIGQLYSGNTYTSDFLNSAIKVVHVQPEDKPLFFMVVNRAKEYFANKQSLDNHLNSMFNN
jgi:hypothetical protein